MKKEPLIFIEHMLESIKCIENDVRRYNTKEKFLKSPKTQRSVIRSIEILGEAVKNILPSFQEKYPSIPWNKIARMRDKLIHDYMGVDFNTVWKVIKEDVPLLKTRLKNILTEEQSDKEKEPGK